MPQKVISYTDPTLDIWARFMRTRNLLYKVFARDLRELGIKPEQLGILNILKKIEGPVTPAMISRVYRREPHTVSVNLKRLEGRGLVKLVKDLEKRNMIRVEITDEGIAIWELGRAKTAAVSQAFKVLSPDDLFQLSLIIDKLSDSAQQVLKSHS
ncbi:MarR family winged helix-turn-helix transcriptional regulator [Dehalogenimonas alkenigignens]|jgi:MarR family transcriptional regulator, organic hydroperoxide resistance regulator|uniref:Transcriptional regulator, MarR family n=1 Tax=Dehalogenimonas alkenigignens TaxID=1217799 RepID=A0A0W0GGV1_9CHLR|nr:MarR family transcriptional regulator [Dehalogenimonas alkenigignens]KTB47785.1 transcriptional regulator, MarR family [Dehalogenimonas alkenigignens]PVV83956.1 MarR family transcriptional regulator [Dehalogenimonas alkenigignens]